MSKARENSLWKWLKLAKQQAQGNLDMHRVENSVSQGMPDVEGFLAGEGYGQFWCELKSADCPKREDTLVRFKVREAQVAWLTRRWQLGGNAWMMLQIGSGYSRDILIVPGGFSRVVCDGLTVGALKSLSATSKNVALRPLRAVQIMATNRH